MILVVIALLLMVPIVEIWLAVQVAGVLGGGLTLLLLLAMSVSGAFLLKRQGTTVWRNATEEMAAGRPPTKELLDGALVLIGGIALMVPGFLTGALGALMMLPPVRALLRPVLLAWMGARVARMARTGRMQGVVVNTVVDAEGRVRTRSRSVGEVIDSEGWDVDGGSPSLPSAGPHPDAIDGDLVDPDRPGPGGPH